MTNMTNHDQALSTSIIIGVLSARPRADLKRKGRRQLPWHERVTTFVS
jgi:hypothetical protein